MRKIVLSILLFIIPITIHSQIKAVTEKGDAIIVYKNGTWKKSNNKKSTKIQKNVTVRVNTDDFTGVQRITTGNWGNFGKAKHDSSLKISGNLVKADGIIAFDIFYQEDLGCIEDGISTMNVKLINGEIINFINISNDCKSSQTFRFLPMKREDFNDENFKKIIEVNLAKLQKSDWEVIRITGAEFYVDIIPNKTPVIKEPEQFFRQHINAVHKK
jgi:hypothetical protein